MEGIEARNALCVRIECAHRHGVSVGYQENIVAALQKAHATLSRSR